MLEEKQFHANGLRRGNLFWFYQYIGQLAHRKSKPDIIVSTSGVTCCCCMYLHQDWAHKKGADKTAFIFHCQRVTTCLPWIHSARVFHDPDGIPWFLAALRLLQTSYFPQGSISSHTVLFHRRYKMQAATKCLLFHRKCKIAHEDVCITENRVA